YFMEMNTRIQVEHPVTEMIHGQDLVVEQLKVAAGEPLGLARRSPALRGHAIEWRINAEDPARGFMPAPGQVARFQPPVGDGVRVDTFLSSGLTLSPYYDSMIAKLIVHGRDRAEALARSVRALDDFVIEGVATTLPWLRWLARHPDLAAGRVHTRWVEQQSEQP
ncbi:MAG: acetyl-CoA carboxylase biotin carboxylase subunit, partial [Gammaproteobacteria bacterium]|nr:acetyl-CoA carboxylase biotin carboxylase subunit [Gammaproteobacteria bacterium]